MRNSMVMCREQPDGRVIKEHIICFNCRVLPVTEADTAIGMETIPEYYSSKEAIENGWKPTTDPIFCPIDERFVWVCPDCLKEYGIE